MRNRIGEALKTFKKVLLWTAGVAALVLPPSVGVMTAAPQRQVYKPGVGGVGYPKCAYCPNPKYSDEGLKARYEGVVVLEAVITAQGRASEIVFVRGPGLGLDKEAVDVVKRWKFKPALGPNGNPVDVKVPIEVTFRLPKQKDSREEVGIGTG